MIIDVIIVVRVPNRRTMNCQTTTDIPDVTNRAASKGVSSSSSIFKRILVKRQNPRTRQDETHGKVDTNHNQKCPVGEDNPHLFFPGRHGLLGKRGILFNSEK
jgi:hypothetical protein